MTVVAEFDYPLPPHAIAQHPIEPRDAARLLDTRDCSDHIFAELPRLLAPGDLVVVNRTRVRAARLVGEKAETGGKVEALLLRRLDPARWEALVRPSRRLRPGTRLVFGPIRGEILTIPVEGMAVLSLEADEDVEAMLDLVGRVPLPPYITTPAIAPDRYQTIFADRTGSAAAPTAGLHFTPRLVGALSETGIELASVELEVGLATFRPIITKTIEAHRIHTEAYRLDPDAAAAIGRCRERGGRVVAIGTTTVRVLETCAGAGGLVEPGAGETSLYLHPGRPYRVVDLLVTNFHLPRSSLILLVAGFMGDGWRGAYQTALERSYRFLSFGDAMLCARMSRS